MQHPCSMQSVRLAVISGLVAAALLVGGLVAAATQASHDSDEGAAVGSSAEARQGHPRGTKVKKPPGPPAWAHAHKSHPGGGPDRADKAWKDAWHAMTPAQREERMTALARAHRQGMRQWAECVAAAGDDATQRSGCEKPLPPGLAKRR